MTLSDYATLHAAVGTAFNVDWAGIPRTLVLESVDEPRTANGFTSFGANFRGDTTVPVEQGSRLFSAEGFAATALFIVPVGSDDRGVLFHAAFSVQEV